jgi:hypothetical protein
VGILEQNPGKETWKWEMAGSVGHVGWEEVDAAGLEAREDAVGDIEFDAAGDGGGGKG